ncbi:hypothetical protein GCM10018780_27880 [Streptomyces lanatus]|nr:hypothetical protein GCM10018780_27880 [Streptomyces lanatus]
MRLLALPPHDAYLAALTVRARAMLTMTGRCSPGTGEPPVALSVAGNPQAWRNEADVA